MFTPLTVIVTILAYMAVLFGFAQLAERSAIGKLWSRSPTVYALGLAVYCTTWTYYGSVGKAAVGGMGFLPVYLGPTLALLVGGTVFRRIVDLKQTHKITSIADFISARYAKSQAVAALVTLILTVGIVPYIALQLKAVTGTFALVTAGNAEASSPLAGWFGPIVVVAMILFTIAFGIRHLDPTERHPGMVVSLAAESLVKLVAFLASGAFVVGAAFGGVRGFGEALEHLSASTTPVMGKSSASDILSWVTVTLLSMAAFAFLPRQFHIGVVEGTHPAQVRRAQWLTPLYLVAINLFVVPIALGGKLLAAKGTSADFYVLSLPLQAGRGGLTLAVFVGGFSAAIGMIMVESMTMATMISNHLVLPVIQALKPLRSLRRRTLQVRWVAAASIIVAGYEFAVSIGSSYMLVAIGLISFAAAFLLAPIVLGGLYWRGGNRAGALMGLSAGFAAWFYTLLLPTFVKSHWLPASILDVGPLGIGALRPEALFGLTGFPALPHGVAWSSLFTVTFYVAGSVLFKTSKEERLLAEAFLDGSANQIAHLDATATLVLDAQRRPVEELLGQFLSVSDAERLTAQALARVGALGKDKMSVVQAAELISYVERSLAGAIGAASAHAAIKKLDTFDRKDKRALEREFARALAELKVSPKELKQRVDYQKEREALLEEQFAALEDKIQQRDAEIVERQKAEGALKAAHDRLEQRVIERTKELRAILDNVVFGFLCVDREGVVGEAFTQSCRGLLRTETIAGRQAADLFGLASAAARTNFTMGVEQVFADVLPEEVAIGQLPSRFVVGDRTLCIEARAVRSDAGVSALLMTISDITQLERAQLQNEQNHALLGILRQRASFEAFLEDTKEQLREARAAARRGDDISVRRAAHTIKGNASLYGAMHIARLIHDIEEQSNIGGKECDDIEAAFREFLDAHSEVLGLSFDGKSARSFSISEVQLDRLRALVTRMPASERDGAIEIVQELTLVRARDLLGPVEALGAALGERLQKKLNVVVVGGDTCVEEALAPVFRVLPHLLRNAIDHGIETVGHRGDKPDCATIEVRISNTLAHYHLMVTDDGSGIDVDRVMKAAEARELLRPEDAARMSRDEKLMLIFADRVSTAADVTEVSGRGVGMSALREVVERLGGVVLVSSETGVGTRVELRIPKQVAYGESASQLRAAG